jgi:predicted phosphodiesterase
MLSLGGCERVAVLTDVHANAGAYRSALTVARERGFDRLVILGDLLSYGCHPAEVLDLTADAVARDGATLLRGNHDQLYLELSEGDTSYYDRLPGWLRECADWTLGAVDLSDFGSRFPWADEVVLGDVFLSHANPFPDALDWSYLNAEADFARAAAALSERGQRVSVGGHTHRRKLARVGPQGVTIDTQPETFRLDLEPGEVALLNPGAVGQPRSADKQARLLFLEARGGELGGDVLAAPYERLPHLAAIEGAGLSADTTSTLLEFFAS